MNLSDADVVLRAPENNELAGWSVSTAGDVNDDGLADVVVGAPYSDNATGNGGAAYVIYGNESLPSAMNLSDADAVLAGTADDGLAGYSVAAVNGTNGTDAVAVGAPYANTTGINAGAAYVVDGDTIADSPGARVNLSNADATFVGERNGSLAGWSVADAGDVNDDGATELAVGAPGYNATAGAVGEERPNG
ncbi:integrin alpha [Halosimplex aquaticum]